MSKALAYVLGILTGVLVTLGADAIMNDSPKDEAEECTNTEKTDTPTDGNTANNEAENAKIQGLPAKGITLFDEPVPFTVTDNFKIKCVVSANTATAYSGEKKSYGYFYSDPTVLIVSDTANSFYDDQIVQAPAGSKVMQIGIYKERPDFSASPTLPVVKIMKKQ